MHTILQQRIKKRNELRNVPPHLLAGISIHVINDRGQTFADIQRLDLYFTKVIQVESMAELIKKLEQQGQLKADDMAAYLVQRYQLNAFLLQKTLYYIYADYLEKYASSPFVANFEAFDHGPVETEVYRKYRYTNNLEEDVAFNDKLAVCPYTTELLDLSELTVAKCCSQYQGAWDDQTKNLTHRAGTPWSRAYARKMDVTILDEDIIKYHHLEHLPVSTN
ncbi:Panacea domain-containing protein [Ligilactobacillus apodemi]|uniref:Panacea domain-containing protein n=1 Tax=Ligilactobacillus apodemi TaxID=307126 RepID=UPI00214C7BB5|nr:Panacea domain-containing protein [Ligilactobacillus apodemi]MCR1901101.1 Panacea domain-containing protein [Ligilactobacillus apodemi]